MPDQYFSRSTRHVLMHMQHVADADTSRLGQLTRRLEDLAPAYGEYLSTLREVRATLQSMDATRAFAGRVSDAWGKRDRRPNDWLGGEPTASAERLRRSTPLWHHLRHYLRFAGEVTFPEVVAAFEEVGIAASRQAIESAIRAHPRVFGRRKRGKYLVVSLKNRAEYVGLGQHGRRQRKTADVRAAILA